MADHGELEYATAEGNDLPAHEAAYDSFTHFVVIGLVYVVNILVGLAIGGVLGHWLTLAAVIIAAEEACIRGRPTRRLGGLHRRGLPQAETAHRARTPSSGLPSGPRRSPRSSE
jgi:Bacterial aa3 type cytochrome c oxidase subunit IV